MNVNPDRFRKEATPPSPQRILKKLFSLCNLHSNDDVIETLREEAGELVADQAGWRAGEMQYFYCVDRNPLALAGDILKLAALLDDLKHDEKNIDNLTPQDKEAMAQGIEKAILPTLRNKLHQMDFPTAHQDVIARDEQDAAFIRDVGNTLIALCESLKIPIKESIRREMSGDSLEMGGPI